MNHLAHLVPPGPTRSSPLAQGTQLLDRLEREIEQTFTTVFPWLEGRVEAFRQPGY